MTTAPETSVAVLVEGRSDATAVRMMCQAADLDDVVTIVVMGGVTNFHNTWARVTASLHPDRVAVLSDGGELRFVVRPLVELGRITVAEDLPRAGVFVCDSDLEEELIRALGPERALAVVDEVGLGGSFTVLTRQPQWEGRPVDEQLHRFAGTGAGRKELLAEAWSGALAADELPAPLRDLREWIIARRG